MKNKVVFLHLPKTGGTSVHEFLRHHFQTELVCPERFNHLSRYSDAELNAYQYYSGHFDFGSIQRISEPKFTLTILREPKKRILSLYYFWRSHKWSTIEKNNLGGPRIAKELDLLSFLKCNEGAVPGNIDNAMSRNLLGEFHYAENGASFLHPKDEIVERVTHNLSSFDHIGLTDNMDDYVSNLASKLNLTPPEKTPHALNSKEMGKINPNLEPVEHEEITTEIEGELERLTKYDQQIYQWVLEKSS